MCPLFRGKINPQFDIFYGASTLITICAEKEGFEPAGDCFLAGQNLMLAACASGLATCPIGFARDVLRTKILEQEFNIPSNYIPVLPIIEGYEKGKAERSVRSPPRILKWLK